MKLTAFLKSHKSGMRRVPAALLILFAIVFTALEASAAPISQARTATGNVYLGGDDVRTESPVKSDLFAAGRRVRVEHAVGADGAIAGANVDIAANIGEDLRVAGGQVSIEANIGADLLAAGGTVKVGNIATVFGNASIAGREVIIDGKLTGGAKIYAASIAISGHIDGDTRLYGEQIVLTPGARITGDLIYASPNPLPEEQLQQVSGTVVREQTPERLQRQRGEDGASGIALFHPAFFLSMLVCGSLLYLLFPNAIDQVRQTIRLHPVRSSALGLALLFSLPPVAILFIITLVGMPIGFGLLALYPLLLMLGYLGAAFFISRVAADVARQPKEITKGRQIFFLAIALIALAITAMVPVLGWFAVFVALIAGIGGWSNWMYQLYRHNGSGPQGGIGLGEVAADK